jgi:hypothetical protein
VDEGLTLADRTFRSRDPLVACGLIMDRDLTAALNFSKLAGSSSESQNACGEASAGCGLRVAVELALLKQEPNTL